MLATVTTPGSVVNQANRDFLLIRHGLQPGPPQMPDIRLRAPHGSLFDQLFFVGAKRAGLGRAEGGGPGEPLFSQTTRRRPRGNDT